MKFLKVDSVDAAQAKLFASAKDWLGAKELLSPGQAQGRILAEDVFAAEAVPSFCRSTVDGFAVLSGDTAAAGESIPVFLTLKGKVEMGQDVSAVIGHGECVEVPTGGMLPAGADAVVMLEYAEPDGAGGIAVCGSVSYGENLVRIGEDIKPGNLLLRKGKRILPQDIGALAAVGLSTVPVYARPRLSVISTGDELVAPEQTPKPGQVRDINTCALTALAREIGFDVISASVLPDDENILEQALRAAMPLSDIVAVSGGSSQGNKDMTGAVIGRVSDPGVYTHGLAIKPGKPTILGYDSASRTILAGLPGHPVSAMMVFGLLFGRLLREITGSAPRPAIPAKISCNVASSPGKLTCWPVWLEWTDEGYTANPLFGKSGLITTLTRAEGYFTVDRNTEGLRAGQSVPVNLF